MSSDRSIRIKESMTVATFLGGFTLAVLTFLFGLKLPDEQVLFFSQPLMDSKSYNEMLIIVTGIISTLSNSFSLGYEKSHSTQPSKQ